MSDLEKILLVEDDSDLVELLAELLRHEGYDVETAADGEQGLAALRAGRFELVISDQRMPGRTGVSMLAEARRAGLLGDAAVLFLTADAEDPDLRGWRVLRKPIDFDVLLDEIHAATVTARGDQASAPAPARAKGGPVIELVLYVTAASPASHRARRNLERVLAGYDRDKIAVRVVDLSEAGVEADPDDRIAFTPTLVKRSPAPRAWLLGDLRDLKTLKLLLDDAGVARRPA